MIDSRDIAGMDMDVFVKEEPIHEYFKPDFTVYIQDHPAALLFDTISYKPITSFINEQQVEKRIGEWPTDLPIPFVSMQKSTPVPNHLEDTVIMMPK